MELGGAWVCCIKHVQRYERSDYLTRLDGLPFGLVGESPYLSLFLLPQTSTMIFRSDYQSETVSLLTRPL